MLEYMKNIITEQGAANSPVVQNTSAKFIHLGHKTWSDITGVSVGVMYFQNITGNFAFSFYNNSGANAININGYSCWPRAQTPFVAGNERLQLIPGIAWPLAIGAGANYWSIPLNCVGALIKFEITIDVAAADIEWYVIHFG